MPVLQLNDQQFPLTAGTTRLGAGADADVALPADPALGVQALIERTVDATLAIRRATDAAQVRVNGVLLGAEATPLMHGDKVEVGGLELRFADDAKAGATQFVSSSDIAAMTGARRTGAARATAASGGRLVSLVDGKEYSVPSAGLSMGRDASSGVVVALSEVSRRHAEIVPTEQGYLLRDTSVNGVFVNGERVQGSQRLARADVLRIGSEEFRFYADVLAPGTGGSAPPVIPSPAGTAIDPRPLLATLETLNEGPSKGARFPLRTPLAHVGRGAHNDVHLPDESVSETHAKLQRRDDGWYVVDMNSTNGTYVGGSRVTSERRLDGSPDVRFGGMKMRFLASDATDAGEAPAAERGRQNAVPANAADARPAPTPNATRMAILLLVAIVAAALVFVLEGRA
jgi:pSer/pThr/pTyr-binding forkhead associated (FHA) protein